MKKFALKNLIGLNVTSVNQDYDHYVIFTNNDVSVSAYARNFNLANAITEQKKKLSYYFHGVIEDIRIYYNVPVEIDPNKYEIKLGFNSNKVLQLKEPSNNNQQEYFDTVVYKDVMYYRLKDNFNVGFDNRPSTYYNNDISVVLKINNNGTISYIRISSLAAINPKKFIFPIKDGFCSDNYSTCDDPAIYNKNESVCFNHESIIDINTYYFKYYIKYFVRDDLYNELINLKNEHPLIAIAAYDISKERLDSYFTEVKDLVKTNTMQYITAFMSTVKEVKKQFIKNMNLIK